MKKRMILISFILLSANAISAMSMGMSMSMQMPTMAACSVSMKPSMSKEYRKREKELVERRERSQIISITRRIEFDLVAVHEGRWPASVLDKNVHFAVYNGANDLLRDLLILGADANVYDHSYKGRPLDIAPKLSTINILLRYKADPKLCENFSLEKLFSYFEPKNLYKKNRKWQEHIAREIDGCMTLLFEKKINVNGHTGPLSRLIFLVDNQKLDADIAQQFVKKLIWKGARISSAYMNSYRALKPHVVHMRKERKRYEATIGFLSCAPYKESPVSQLPEELKRIIAELARQGFEFHYLEEPALDVQAEDRAYNLPLQTDQNNNDISETPIQAEADSVAEVINTVENQDMEQEIVEESDSESDSHREEAVTEVQQIVPQQKPDNTSLRKHVPQKIVAFCIAAGAAKLTYEAWKKYRLRKKRQERRRLFLQNYVTH